MLDRLLDVLGNSHFEAYFAGPLVGAVFGIILTALSKPPGPSKAGSSPDDVKQQIEAHRQRFAQKTVVHHHYHSGPKTDDDGGAVLIIGALVLVVALLLFSAFLPQIAGTLYFFSTAVAMSCFTTAVLACLSGNFNTAEWWKHAIFPALTSIGCFWLTVKAQQAVAPEVVAYAHGLLGDKPFNLGTVLSAAIKFFSVLGNEYFQWLLFDMLAFLCIVVCAAFAFLRCVYYVSLSNARESQGQGWVSLALWTERFSGKGSMAVVLILFLFGASLATGHFYQLIHSPSSA